MIIILERGGVPQNDYSITFLKGGFLQMITIDYIGEGAGQKTNKN